MYKNVYNYCIGCERSFLPDKDGLEVAALTKDSIGHQGCRDINELYNYFPDEHVKLRDNEPAELAQDILLFITLFLFLLVSYIVTIKICCTPKNASNGKVWAMPQNIPKWSFEKMAKPQEVPYIIIDEKPIKSLVIH